LTNCKLQKLIIADFSHVSDKSAAVANPGVNVKIQPLEEYEGYNLVSV